MKEERENNTKERKKESNWGIERKKEKKKERKNWKRQKEKWNKKTQNSQTNVEKCNPVTVMVECIDYFIFWFGWIVSFFS